MNSNIDTHIALPAASPFFANCSNLAAPWGALQLLAASQPFVAASQLC
jgi:hypothetical protein